MRAVIQRVEKAGVFIRESGVEKRIGKGLVVLLGIGKEDNEDDLKYLSEKIVNLRIFPDAEGKMNLSILDVKGEVLIVSQFTLYGNTSRGRRPDFVEAAEPRMAKDLYEEFVNEIRKTGLQVENGEFAANMLVEIHNNGPVTFFLDSKEK